MYKLLLDLILHIDNVYSSLSTCMQPVIVISPWVFLSLKLRRARSHLRSFHTPIDRDSCMKNSVKGSLSTKDTAKFKVIQKKIAGRWNIAMGLFYWVIRIILDSFIVSIEHDALYKRMKKCWLSKKYLSSSVTLSRSLESRSLEDKKPCLRLEMLSLFSRENIFRYLENWHRVSSCKDMEER